MGFISSSPPGRPPPACRTDKSPCRTRTIRPLTGASRADRAPSRRAYARGAVGRPMGDSDATRDLFSPLAARVRPTASLASTRSPSSLASRSACVWPGSGAASTPEHRGGTAPHIVTSALAQYRKQPRRARAWLRMDASAAPAAAEPTERVLKRRASAQATRKAMSKETRNTARQDWRKRKRERAALQSAQAAGPFAGWDNVSLEDLASAADLALIGGARASPEAGSAHFPHPPQQRACAPTRGYAPCASPAPSPLRGAPKVPPTRGAPAPSKITPNRSQLSRPVSLPARSSTRCSPCASTAPSGGRRACSRRRRT